MPVSAPPIDRLRRLRNALVAVLAGVAVTGGLTTVAHADGAVASPQTTWAVGSAGMVAAQQIARAHWGVDPCGGQVAITWTQLDADINAVSSWSNPRSSYDDPQLNSDCSIQFNTVAPFDWSMFCTVVVHEYGHLSGKPHSTDPNDVMAPIYSKPVPECVDSPAGAATVAPGPAPATTTATATAATRTAVTPASAARKAQLQRAAARKAAARKAARARAARRAKAARAARQAKAAKAARRAKSARHSR
jgi:hypothetical protein